MLYEVITRQREARLGRELDLLSLCQLQSGHPLAERLRQVCLACARLLELDRVSVWRYRGRQLENLHSFHRPSDRHVQEPSVTPAQFAALFDYLPAQPFLDAHHARVDPRTREADARITSYNVCYTKLLRPSPAAACHAPGDLCCGCH